MQVKDNLPARASPELLKHDAFGIKRLCAALRPSALFEGSVQTLSPIGPLWAVQGIPTGRYWRTLLQKSVEAGRP